MNTFEFIDLLFPEHGRTSCSDDNLNNGLEEDGSFRCDRCFLLEIANGRVSPEKFKEIINNKHLYISTCG